MQVQQHAAGCGVQKAQAWEASYMGGRRRASVVPATAAATATAVTSSLGAGGCHAVASEAICWVGVQQRHEPVNVA